MIAVPALVLLLAPASADAVMASGRALTATAPCLPAAAGEIAVCGRRSSGGERFRLPLPGERETPTGPARGEAARATVAPGGPLACGMFQGQRRCGKAEARLHGLGGGRDPLTIVGGLVTLLIDPDADVARPAPVPR